MNRPSSKRKALQPILQPNSFTGGAAKNTRRALNSQRNKIELNKKNEEEFIETEEDMFEAAVHWDEEQREKVIAKQKSELVDIRDRLLNEKKRLLMKESDRKAKEVYLDGISKVYETIKSMSESECEYSEEKLNEVMSNVVYPEDTFPERDHEVDNQVYKVTIVRPKELPACALHMCTEDFNAFKEAFDLEEQKSRKCMIPTNKNLEQKEFNEENVTKYKNWLNAVADEVDYYREKEQSMDQALGELDSSIEQISMLIRICLKCLGLTPKETGE